MSNRRFEMYQYRQVLTRMRFGDSDRAIARSGLMGRQKASALRKHRARVPKSVTRSSPEQAAWAKVKVHGDCHVEFEKCRYSVPYAFVCQQLWLRASPTTVWIYQNQEMVAVHPRKNTPGARSTINEHLPPDPRAFLMRDPQWCLKKAQTIGPACHTLIKTLFRDRVLDNLRAAQGVIGLSERYGARRLEAACDRAMAFDNPRYRSVKSILEKGLDQCKHPSQMHTDSHTLAAAYTGKGRFCRDATTLFS